MRLFINRHLQTILWLLLLIVIILSLLLSPSGIHLPSPFILWHIRMPRLIALMLGGSALALAGILLQTWSKNPLADSSLLGITAGSGLAYALCLTIGSLASSVIAMPIALILGGLVATGLIYALSYQKGRPLIISHVLLMGMALASFLTNLTILFAMRLMPQNTENLLFFLSGNPLIDYWGTIVLWGSILLTLIGIAYGHAYHWNILNLSDTHARSLGAPVYKRQIQVLILSSLLTALATVFVGNIAFLGMACGLSLRKHLGSLHQQLIPASLAMGASLTLIADLLNRLFFSHTPLPTGLVLLVLLAGVLLGSIKKDP